MIYILRGLPDKIQQGDNQPFGDDDQARQVLKLIREDIVKMVTETQNIIRGTVATTSNDPNIPSLIGKCKKNHILLEYCLLLQKWLIRLYPDLMWKVNDNNQTIFHIAVEHRHEHIYNILYEVGSMKELITPLRDGNGNNMLHLVGKRPKNERLQHVSALALQMQRELLWFKEVETMIPPAFREQKNKDGLTPHELFTKEHKDLATHAEKWMEEIASQLIVVAALIATIVFAATFTIPVADAISFLSSTASILMFLSILTSRNAERDFLGALHNKLVLALETLFLSIITMTNGFILRFFVLYNKDLKWIPILIGVCSLTGLCFFFDSVASHADIIYSAYGSRYLFKPRKPIFYHEHAKF
ncbi:hypothetical protein OSB04_028124 [Centaurea solstitialis]|uniref:PGG domain-containing protein n=1 Tax=Centaurea solstitialis TaxID=347529 RepID=A0AA38SFW8_9ASTR|nr:hypothetical protein OSB04_028124 [Centaurea solstitialis]